VELAELARKEILMIRMMLHTGPDFGNGRHAGRQPVSLRMFAGRCGVFERTDSLTYCKLVGRVGCDNQKLNFRFGLDDGDEGDSHGRLQKGARVSSAWVEFYALVRLMSRKNCRRVPIFDECSRFVDSHFNIGVKFCSNPLEIPFIYCTDITNRDFPKFQVGDVIAICVNSGPDDDCEQMRVSSIITILVTPRKLNLQHLKLLRLVQ
jgi:hypothetical protein